VSATATAGASAFVPARGGIRALRSAVQECRGCELYRDATQAVFGSGLISARIMMLGEQPGDREDREGKPFVGPAGRELRRGMDEAGINESDVYLTNVVKHFRFEERGKRRIHQKPGREHVAACRPWLDAELERVDPELVICLGATAAQAVLGRRITIGEERGAPVESPLTPVLFVTVHPSSILRARDRRDQAREEFTADLKAAAAYV
jgi:DNA polymerase